MRALFALAFAAALLGADPVPAGPRIAVTIDDVPVQGPLPPGETATAVAARMIEALSGADQAPATIFVNGVALDRTPDAAQALARWGASGRPLGNHTWSHPNLDDVDAAAFEADVARNEPLLADMQGGAAPRWFRYPYLAEGRDPATRERVRRFLFARGYRVASVTLNFDDWAWNGPYVRCLAQQDHDAVAALEQGYLDAAAAALAHARGLSHALYGQDIPYVLLLHTGVFNARMLDRVLALYRDSGATFVTLDEAQAHPFYAPDMGAAPSSGPLSLAAALAARGETPPPRPSDIADLETVCR